MPPPPSPRRTPSAPPHDAGAAEDAAGSSDEDDPKDAALETSSNYSTASEDSLPPIRRYGHTYHGSGRLIAPNDDSEIRRLALQHELYKLCLDGELVASKLPLRPGGSIADADASPDARFQILDVGTGSGVWALDVAARYPQADVLGLDLSAAMLPRGEPWPRNLTFEIADVAEPWPPGRAFDFIHMRNLIGGGVRDWQALLDRAWARLKPGGTLEFSDIRFRFLDRDPAGGDDAAMGIGKACLEYERLFGSMCASLGMDFDPIPSMAEMMSRLGAEWVRERSDWLPMMIWGSDPAMRRKGEIVHEIFMRTCKWLWCLVVGSVC